MGIYLIINQTIPSILLIFVGKRDLFSITYVFCDFFLAYQHFSYSSNYGKPHLLLIKLYQPTIEYMNIKLLNVLFCCLV